MSKEFIRADMTFLMTARYDFERYLFSVASYGGNTVRFPLIHVDGDITEPVILSPFNVIDMWNPYKLVGEDGPDVPMYDLRSRNPEWWLKFCEILYTMREVGITPWLCIEDRCSEALSGWQRFLSPLYSNPDRYPYWDVPESDPNHYSKNPNGVDPAIGGSHLGLGLDDLRYQFELDVITQCYEYGITKVIAEPKNEIGYATATVDEHMPWIRSRLAALKNLKYTTTISIRDPLSNDLIFFDKECQKSLDFIDWHGHNTSADVKETEIPNSRIILNMDGGFKGEGVYTSIFGIRDESPAQAHELGAYIRQNDYAGGCYLCQSQIDDEHLPWHIDIIDHRPLGAMNEELGWEEPPPIETVWANTCLDSSDLANIYCPNVLNKEYIAGTEPTKICTLHQAPEPPEPEKSCWEKYMADRPIGKWQVGKFIKCIFGMEE